MKLAKCPYCGRRLSYHTAFLYKSKGEYECSRCKKKSNVSIKKKMWLAFTLTMLVAIIIMIVDIVYFAETKPFIFLTIFIPFVIFYMFVPFFVHLRPLKKYREFVNRQQKYSTKPEIIAPINDSDYGNGANIDKDVYNQIKAKRKIITEDESGTTRAFSENGEFKKVETDTISTSLLREKTAAFTLKNKDFNFDKENSKQKDNFLDNLFDGN
ncbi:MAG: hypothetical protein IJV39_01740 [Ruminococcus sp.]|nr:hypothetical protein [Ruminococcus sp.]